MQRLLRSILFVGCIVGCDEATAPQPFELGADTCAHCRMTIVDARYGGELVTAEGKIHKFDTLECLSRFESRMTASPAAVYYSDFSHPGHFLPQQGSVLIHSPSPSGPMGAALVAFESIDAVRETFHLTDRDVVTVEDLPNLP